jgi:spore coat polysaccharide biosynthesis protein SpsF
MGSERLPGKVLLDIQGKPMLARVLERADRCPNIDQVVVATTWESEDDPVAAWGNHHDYSVVRGHPTDVLDRYHQAAEEAEAETVVRFTADCPLLDPAVSDQTIQRFLEADPPLDFVANRLPDHRTYPIGLDTEVCSREALEQAWREAQEPHQREHVMPYLYENPDFEIELVEAEDDWGDERWTVDTPADLAFVRAVYQAFSPRDDFGWREVLELLEARPALRKINQEVEHRSLKDTDQRFSSAGSEGS